MISEALRPKGRIPLPWIFQLERMGHMENFITEKGNVFGRIKEIWMDSFQIGHLTTIVDGSFQGTST